MDINNQYNPIDVETRAEQLRGFKAAANKYGFAAVVLTLNNYIAPILFVFAAVFLGSIINVDFFENGTNIAYCSSIILNEISAYAIPITLLYFMFRNERKSFIPDKSYSRIPLEAVLMFAAGMTAGALGSAATQAINSVIDKIFHTGEIKEAFSGSLPQNVTQFAVFAFCICFVAPIAEEFLFRDLLLKPLRAYGDLTAAVVSGLFFGLYHGNFDQFAYAALTGFFFSVIAIKYNSILPTVLLHTANNILVTCSAYLPGAAASADEQTKAALNKAAEICSSFAGLIIYFGGAAFLFLAAKRCFRLHNHNRYVPEPRAIIDFFTAPMAVAGCLIMLSAFFI